MLVLCWRHEEQKSLAAVVVRILKGHVHDRFIILHALHVNQTACMTLRVAAPVIAEIMPALDEPYSTGRGGTISPQIGTAV